MFLERLPQELLILIGLKLDWESIHCCYRLLTKRFYRLFRDSFWQRKYQLDIVPLRTPFQLYPNYFYYYLGERSRWLMTEIRKFHLSRRSIRIITMKTWCRIFQFELKKIQNILISYLTEKYPNYFQYHVPNNSAKGCNLQIYHYNLLFEFRFENDAAELVDRINCRAFMVTNNHCDYELDLTLPKALFNFLWELGISSGKIRKLYSIPDYIQMNLSQVRGPYSFKELIPLRKKLTFNYGEITSKLIVRYFGSEERHIEFLKNTYY